MTQLIDPSDPRYFQLTSEGNYDRHHYRLYFKDGNNKYFEDWEQVQSTWFQWSSMNLLSHVEVLDKPKEKSKGFK
jgi:hypothetical protein